MSPLSLCGADAAHHCPAALGPLPLWFPLPSLSLRSTLCLQYPPDLICVGVISLSLTYKQYEQPVRAGGSAQARPWHEELFDVDRQTIDCQQQGERSACVLLCL
jgi:hypothetical protein